MLTLGSPRTNLHVFGPDCQETALTAVNGTVMDYNKHKEPVLRQIFERMFRAYGLQLKSQFASELTFHARW